MERRKAQAGPRHDASHRAWGSRQRGAVGADTRSRLRAGAVCLAVVVGVSAVLAWLLYAEVTSTCSGAGCPGSSGGFLIVGVLAALLAMPAFVEPAAIVVADRPGGPEGPDGPDRRRRLRTGGWAALASLGWTSLWMGLVYWAVALLPGSDRPVLQAVTIALVGVTAATVVLLPLLGRRRVAVETARVVFVVLTLWAVWRFGTLGG